MIPKILLQCSKEPYPKYVVDIWNKRLDDSWKIEWFDDNRATIFFKENPLPEFPDVDVIFNNIKLGEHKADFFRYYFLYIAGGVFVDSDLLLTTDLNHYVEKYIFFTCESDCGIDSYFNGLLGSEPKNKIIYECLEHAYNLFKNNPSPPYMEVCVQLKKIVLKSNCIIKLLNEVVSHEKDEVIIFDQEEPDKLIGIHFQPIGYIPIDYKSREFHFQNKLKGVVSLYKKILKRNPNINELRDYIFTEHSLREIKNILLSHKKCITICK